MYALVELLEQVLAIRRDGGSVIGCMLTRARGSTPQAAGAIMLVDDRAQLYGTIGGGCVEAEVRRRAHTMLAAGESGIMQFKLDHDYGWDDGLICGGTVELAVGPLPDNEEIESIIDALRTRRHTSLTMTVQLDDGPGTFTLDLPAKPRLLIAGAGHIGATLARQALLLDFDVTLLDDRPDLLSIATPPGARSVAGDIAETLASECVDETTYIVIVTRGHRHDEQALEATVGRGAKYVGMIGSRRKVKLTFDDLIERGVDPHQLETVHAPVGLDIGSVSVEEIALSIAAQLVAVRRADRVKPVSGPVDPANRSATEAKVSAHDA